MRRRKERLQHYVAGELRQKIRALAAAQNVTESSVTEAALAEYFDREGTDRDWLARRLDLIGHGIAQGQADAERERVRVRSGVELVSDALGVFVRHVFLPAITKAGPDQDQRVDTAYQTFLRRVADHNCQSGKLRRDVQRADSSTAAAGKPGSTVGGR